MSVYAQIAVGLVGLIHFGFAYLEIGLWNKPLGRQIFNLDEDFAERSKPLAANQGLYNAFLGAGLLWSIFPLGAWDSGMALATFFLWCVILAGIFGAATVSQRILQVQALPGLIALVIVWAVPA